MAFLVSQVNAPAGWLHVAASGSPPDEATSQTQAQAAATVVYPSGSPDTIPVGALATVYGGTTPTFDRTAGPWLVLSVRASLALQVVKESDLGTVTGDYAVLARITRLVVESYHATAGSAGGSGAFVWVTKTANYTITGADLTAGHGFLVDASGGAVTITLPTAVGVTVPVTIKRIDTTYANAATIAPHASETLEGATSAPLLRQWHTYEWGSDNANWWIKSGFFANPLEHEGSVAVGDANAVPTELVVGADGTQLTSRSTATLGVDFE